MVNITKQFLQSFRPVISQKGILQNLFDELFEIELNEANLENPDYRDVGILFRLFKLSELKF